jgi:lipoprotein-anchoring transpeptidase ErfK/SrfK
LVAGFVSAQLFLPATSQLSLAEDGGQVAKAPLVAAPAEAGVLPKVDTSVQAVTPAKSHIHKPPAHSGTGYRVVYSVSRQRVWTVGSGGNVKRTYLVSGRLSQPRPGHYRVYSKSRWTSSTVSAETMQYMIRFTHGERTGTPIGFHSIPRDYSGHPAESVHDLGKPVSAGCIRQRLRDAAYLWAFAPVGTTVVVVH